MSESSEDNSHSIESGEYYRDAIKWYGTMYHSPIGERALLIIITVIAGIITFMAMICLFMLMPLAESKPVVIRIPDSLDKIVHVQPMMAHSTEDPNEAVMRWFVSNFIEVREGYDIEKQEMLHKRVWVLSAPQVYREYVKLYKGPQSPTIKYERHTKRNISVRNVQITNVDVIEPASGESPGVSDIRATVEFVATENTSNGNRKSVWDADITFRFSEIHVNQATGKITAMEFKVTGYESKQTGLE